MASTYSSLKIQLMTTGENNTTWGDITNLNLGTAIEEAITGSADVSFLGVDVTLLLVDSPTSQTARNLRLNLTGTSGGVRNLIVPAIEKFYIVNNGCADAVTIKNATGTGISVPAGKTTTVFNNGTNVVDAINYLSSLTTGTSIVAGTSIASGTSLAAGTSLAYTTTLTGGTGIVNLGSGQFYKDASGNVGIGTTTNTLYKLQATGLVSSFTAAQAGYHLYNNGANAEWFMGQRSAANHSLSFSKLIASVYTDYMVISTGGLVGIGTTAPATQLDVRNGDITLSRTAAATAGDAALNFGNGGTAYIFAGNTSNIMAFAVNSSERMRIDASGNVGIGTSAPATYGKLAVVGTGLVNSAIVGDNTSEGQLTFSNVTAGRLSVAASFPLIMQTNSAERMRIRGNGDVTIGDAAATAAGAIRYFDVVNLENTNNSSAADIRLITQNVAGSGSVAVDLIKTKGGAFSISNTETNAAAYTSFGVGASERMRINNSGDVGIGTTTATGKFNVTGAAAGLSAYFTDAANSSLAIRNAVGGVILGTDSGGLIHFATNGNTTAERRMTIDTSGSVGVGTTTPEYKLHVANGYTGIGGFNTSALAPSSAVGVAAFSWNRSSGGGETNIANTFNGATSSFEFLQKTGASTANVLYQMSSSSHFFYTANTEKMRIDNSGNVGIGTTSTTNRLQIDGGAVQNTGIGNIGQYELVSGSASTWYNSGWRNDGANVYFLLSNVQTTQAAAKSAGFNSLRPIVINLATGQVNIDATGAGSTTFGGAALAVGAGGLGYGTGSGGAVTQLTSRTTGVTLNKTNGAITMFSAAGNASPQTFVVTNSTVAISDVVVVSVRSSTNVYSVSCISTSAGAFAICFYSLSGTATDAPVINFAVIKAVTA